MSSTYPYSAIEIQKLANKGALAIERAESAEAHVAELEGKIELAKSLSAEVERLKLELAEERLLWPTPGHLEKACANFVFYVIDHGTISPPEAALYFDLMRKAIEESREQRGQATVAHEELPALREQIIAARTWASTWKQAAKRLREEHRVACDLLDADEL